MSSSASSNPFLACNATELYQLCRKQGMNISPDTSREDMAAYLYGDKEAPEEGEHLIDDWRQAIMAFLTDHWQVVRAQVNCPAKNLMKEPLEPGEKRACFNCVDTQVLACVVTNPENEELIQLKRKRKTP